MTERLEHDPQVFVGIMPSGTAVFVGVAKRDEFDRLALPCLDHGENDSGHVLSKSLEADGVRIVFQYWLKSRTFEALIADNQAERDRRAIGSKSSLPAVSRASRYS